MVQFLCTVAQLNCAICLNTFVVLFRSAQHCSNNLAKKRVLARRRKSLSNLPRIQSSAGSKCTTRSTSLRARLTQHPAPVAQPPYPPARQYHGNRRSRDREDWLPQEIDQRHGERRHESTAEDGTRDD